MGIQVTVYGAHEYTVDDLFMVNSTDMFWVLPELVEGLWT